MKKEQIHQRILIERDRAERLHPDWPKDIIHAAAIVAEEAGELMKACLDLVYFHGDFRNVENEAVSVGAMIERFLIHFPKDYKITNNHLRKEFDPRFKRKNQNGKK